MDILYFFIPMILFLGIITSYDDIKKGKIRNRWIIAALIYSFVILFLIILNLYFSNMPIELGYISDYAINFAFSFFIGFFIWYTGLWSAGDAKLFLAYSALLPLSAYINTYIHPFPSIMILINSFVPLFAFFIIKLVVHTDLKTKIKSFKKAMTVETIATLMVSFFGISYLLRLLLLFLDATIDMFTMLFLFFLIYTLLEKAFGKNLIKIMIMISSVGVVLSYEYVMTMEFLNLFLITFFSYIFIRYFLIRLAYDTFSRSVNIDDLKSGMILSDIFYKEGKIYKKKDGVKFSITPSTEKLHKLTDSKFLTEDAIKKIKKLHIKGKFPYETVRVNETIPFAPILFSGVLLTIIFHGSFMLIIDFLSSFL